MQTRKFGDGETCCSSDVVSRINWAIMRRSVIKSREVDLSGRCRWAGGTNVSSSSSWSLCLLVTCVPRLVFPRRIDTMFFWPSCPYRTKKNCRQFTRECGMHCTSVTEPTGHDSVRSISHLWSMSATCIINDQHVQ